MGGSGGAGGGGDLDAADDGNPDRAPLVCPPASGEAEGASCSALEAEGPCVEQVQVDDSAPAPAGGTLVAGTYDLTERILYTNPGGPVGPTGGDPKRETMILAFTDGAWSLSVASLTGAVASRRLATVAPSGTRLGLVATCPAAGDGGTGGSAGGLYFTASEQALRLLEIRASGPVALDSYKRRAP
jgi:hypothetical protein